MSRPGQTEKDRRRPNHCRSTSNSGKSLRAGGYCRSVATNDLPLGDHSSSSNVLVGPMTRWEAAADDRRGRAFVRQGNRELGELAEPTVDLDCAILLR